MPLSCFASHTALPLSCFARLRTRSLTFGQASLSSVRSLALVAQSVEHFHGKEKVTGPIPVKGSTTIYKPFKIFSVFMRRKARKLCKNCQTPVKRSVDVFCNGKCQHEHAYAEYIKKWLDNKVDGTIVGGISGYVRRYLLKTHGEQCSLCGWNERNPITMKVPLEVDHIDGNHKNSTVENLRLICPNCHSLTPTFRGLNKGNGRDNRLKRPLSSYG